MAARSVCSPRSRSGGGLDWTAAKISDVDAVRAAMRPTTRIVWVETPTNPLLGIADIAGLASVAHDQGRAARCRQHVREPVSAAAARLRRRRGRALDHQVRGRAFGRRGWCPGGSGRGLAQDLAYYQNAMGAINGPFDRLADPAGCEDSRRTDGSALRQRRAGGGVPDRAQAGGGGALTRDCRSTPATRWPRSRSSLRRHGQLPRRRGEAAAIDICNRTRLFVLGESLGGVESLIRASRSDDPRQRGRFRVGGAGGPWFGCRWASRRWTTW